MEAVFGVIFAILFGTVAFISLYFFFEERKKNTSLTQSVANLNQDVIELRDSLEIVLMENQQIRAGIPKLVEAERADAIKSSKSIIKGFVGEQFAAYLPDSKYKPADFKALFSPVDFVIFDGMSQGNIKNIVLLDVKTSNAMLTDRQKMIQKCVEEGRVKFETFRIKDEIPT